MASQTVLNEARFPLSSWGLVFASLRKDEDGKGHPNWMSIDGSFCSEIKKL